MGIHLIEIQESPNIRLTVNPLLYGHYKWFKKECSTLNSRDSVQDVGGNLLRRNTIKFSFFLGQCSQAFKFHQSRRRRSQITVKIGSFWLQRPLKALSSAPDGSGITLRHHPGTRRILAILLIWNRLSLRTGRPRWSYYPGREWSLALFQEGFGSVLSYPFKDFSEAWTSSKPFCDELFRSCGSCAW